MTETRLYKDLMYGKMANDLEQAMNSHLNIWHILHIICKKMFHEFYKHSFWYVRVDASWKNMVPYNRSPKRYIRFCNVIFNNWNMKMITLPDTDCELMNSGVITLDKSDVHVRGKDQRSKFKVTEVKTQLSRFRT